MNPLCDLQVLNAFMIALELLEQRDVTDLIIKNEKVSLTDFRQGIQSEIDSLIKK